MSMSSLDRRDAVATLLKGRRDLVVVTGLGSATYDVAAVGDHDRNVYLWGAMGGTATLALGLALAQPTTPVLVVTGDGEMLMGMGAFATIAGKQPKNLSVVVLDNGLYGETGGQESHTATTDLAGVARACGIADTRTITDQAGVEAFAARVHALGAGPAVAVIKIKPGELTRVLPTRDGHAVRLRVRHALGVE